MADELNISGDGHYLYDGKDWISVEHVPLGTFEHLPGAHLSRDYNFWWNHVTGQWQRVADAPASAHPPAGPPAAANPVSSTTAELNEPPTPEQMKWGREVLDVALMSVVPEVTEVAEKVVELSGNADEVLKVLEKGGEGVHALEVLGLHGGAIFAGATAATIIVPFAMWYEAIGANNAGDKHYVRWLIYDPWMHGLIGGLYGQNIGHGEEPFAGWHQQGEQFVSGMDDSGKRALTGALIAAYVYNTSSTEAVNEQLTHDQWAKRSNWPNAYEGLKFALSAADS